MSYYGFKGIGVWDNWPECQKATTGKPGYPKKFPTKEEAEEFAFGEQSRWKWGDHPQFGKICVNFTVPYKEGSIVANVDKWHERYEIVGYNICGNITEPMVDIEEVGSSRWMSIPYSDFEKGYILCNPDEYRAWTDGSSKTGKYGAGVYIERDDKLTKKIIAPGTNKDAANINNIAGELSAAMSAVVWAISNKVEIRIYHDLEGISKWYNGEFKCDNKFTQAYYKFMHEREKYILGFVWIRGHKGIGYNEEADRLAKIACNGCDL
jgi:ribonuclease HI